MSLTKVTNSMIEGAAINVLDYGVTGDGVSFDNITLANAFNAAAAFGKTVYVPAGNYLCNDIVSVSLTSSTKGISVICDAGATFIKSATFPNNKQLFLFLATSGDQSVSWVGGKLDGRLAPVKAAGTAPDLMSINGGQTNINKVYVSDVYFLNNDDRTGTAGDSCLFVAGCNDVSIVNNVFQGAVDLGLYISGQATTFVGERIYVSGNKFIECIFGVGSKREYQNHIIDSNFFSNCNICIFIGGETEFLNTAKKAVITSNIIENCGRGIEIRVCDGTIVANNRIEDYGVDSTGTPTAESGILISGSQNCIVTNNYIGTSGAFVPDAGSRGIGLTSRTIDAITYLSEYNYISNNYIYAASIGVVEITGSNSDFNLILNNQFKDVTALYQIIGTSTNIGQIQSFKGPDPVVTIQDTEVSLAGSIARLRLGESGAGGALENYFETRFDGSAAGQVFGFGNALAPSFTDILLMRYNNNAVNFVPQVAKTDVNGVAGDVYYNSTTNKLQCHNGTAWQDLF